MGRKTYKIKIDIPVYILEIVLPEVSHTYGKTVASVYLQILTHICKKKDTSSYFKNKQYVRFNSCFMKSSVYKEHIKYSQRSINKAMNILKKLELITEIKANVCRRFRVFELNNVNLKTDSEITSFLDTIEKKLLKDSVANPEKLKAYFSTIREIMVSSDKITNNKLAQRKSYEDVELLRTWLTETESIYKGSSLFFVLNVLPYLYKANKRTDDKPIKLAELTLRQRALCAGVDDSTAYRIVSAYKAANVLSFTKGPTRKELYTLNETMLSNDKICLVGAKEKKTKVACPICGKEFASSAGVSVHISHQKDSVHKDYVKHRQTIKEQAKESQKQILEQIKTIKCKNCLIKCCECQTEWKEEFSECKEDTKKDMLELVGKYQTAVNTVKRMSKIVDEPETNTLQVHANEDIATAVIAKATKKRKPRRIKADSAPGLVKFFYDKFGGNSPSWARECHQVKLLLDNGVEPDCIRDAMILMKKRGNNDLRYISGYSITDIMETKKLLKESGVKGTNAYYVRKYYDGMNIPFSDSDIVEDVKRVVRLRNERNVDNDKLEFIVDYMIKNNTPTFNFLDSQAKAALTKYEDYVTIVGSGEDRKKANATDHVRTVADKYHISVESAEYLDLLYNLSFDSPSVKALSSELTEKIIADVIEDIIMNGTYNTEKYNALDFAYYSKAYLTKTAKGFISNVKQSAVNEDVFNKECEWLKTVTTV